MKRILLLLLLLPNLLVAQRNTDFVIEIKNGFQYLNHVVKRGESLLDLSNAYSVKVQVLENINHFNSNIVLKENQLVMIPLMETNFFKMTGITSAQNGFYPLYYKVMPNENIEAVCSKFSLLPAAIKKWNHDNYEDELQENEKIIVGWIKYKSANSNIVVNRTPVVNTTSKPISAPSVQSGTKNEMSTAPKQTVQNTAVTKATISNPSSTTEVKEDSKVNQFLSKVKTSLKPKHDEVKTEEKSNKAELKSTVKKEESSSSTSSKKSVKQIWNSLVNGKEKSSAAPVVKQTAPATTRPIATKPAPKNNVLYEKSMQAKTSTPPVTKTQVASKPMNNYNNKPVVKETGKPVDVKTQPKKVESVSNQTAPLANSTPKVNVIKKEVKEEVKVVKETPVKVAKVEVPTKKVEVIEKPKSEVKKVDTKAEAEIEKVVELSPIIETEPEVIKPLHNEVKALELNESKSGKCAYFFSGPTSGRFYVFTNLATKGNIVKVTNTANNRFVMAEVIGNLPMSDVTKGLLIKLSDNAKLALSQKNNLFLVKVNY